MKLTLFEMNKETIFPQLFENPLNGINISSTWVLGINKNII